MDKNKKSLKPKVLSKIVVILIAFGILIVLGSGIFLAGIEYNKLFKDKVGSISSTPTSTETILNPFNFCRHMTPYTMEPRFTRALSLLTERISETNTQNTTLHMRFYLKPILPCLDVQYCDATQMNNAEGIFTFSEDTANRDRLLICVSEKYKEEDDLVTATLIAHEATHAIQFVLDSTKTTYGLIYNNSCYGKEAMAFAEQTLFMRSLTNGELQSLFARMFDNSILNPSIGTAKTLFTILMQSGETCIQQSNTYDERVYCTIKEDVSRLEEMVRKNSYYQAECGR